MGTRLPGFTLKNGLSYGCVIGTVQEVYVQRIFLNASSPYGNNCEQRRVPMYVLKSFVSLCEM